MQTIKVTHFYEKGRQALSSFITREVLAGFVGRAELFTRVCVCAGGSLRAGGRGARGEMFVDAVENYCR